MFVLSNNDFDLNIYKNLYKDLIFKSNDEYLIHYEKYGKFENRIINKILLKEKINETDFDEFIYKSSNPDLKNLNRNELVNHFTEFGIYEDRIWSINTFIKNKNFNIDTYKKINPDMINFDLKKTIYHYLVHGVNEHRFYSYNKYIDTYYFFDHFIYKKFNKDLEHLTKDELYKHFFDSGRFENRIYSSNIFYRLYPNFNINYYKKNKCINMSVPDMMAYYHFNENKNIQFIDQRIFDWNNNIQNDNNYIIYFFNNDRGYGDFMRGLCDCFLLAIILERKFYVYMTNSNLKNVINLPIINELPKNNIFFNLIDYQNIINRNSKDSVSFIDHLKNKDLNSEWKRHVIIKVNICFFYYLMQNKYYENIMIMELIKYIYRKFYNIFTLKFDEPKYDDYIGIHLRLGDVVLRRNNPNNPFACDHRPVNDIEFRVSEILKQNKKIFVCSDNDDIIEQIQKISGDYFIKYSRNTVVHSNDTESDELVKEMVEQHYILSKSNKIYSNYSQYNYTASLVGNICNYDFSSFMLKKDDELLQLHFKI